MLIERKWKKWVYFYVPLALFIVVTLFPFYWMSVTAIRPDNELYRSWRAANNTPLWTLSPTFGAHKGSPDGNGFSKMALKHLLYCRGIDWDLSFLRIACGIRPCTARFPYGRHTWYGNLYHIPGTTYVAVHSSCRYHSGHPTRRHSVGTHPDLPNLLDSVLHLVINGLLQDNPSFA